MVNSQKNTKEQPCRRLLKKEINLDGITYRVCLYSPTDGKSDLVKRLMRLMERAVMS